MSDVKLSPSGLKIVADENIPGVEQMFESIGAIPVISIERVDGRRLAAEQVEDADVLLVRSVTKVDKKLLANSAVKFVGSATIGTDHLDKSFLKAQGIHYCSAPGCNADAVVEYDLCCLSLLLEGGIAALADKTVAIVGVGNVGSRLAERLSRIGVKSLLLNDPPRAQTEEGFSDLSECFAQADIVALHTPLTKEGRWPSHHLVTKGLLDTLKPNAVLINAGRGPAINEQDLLAFLTERSDVKTAIDVWEYEPQINPELAALVDIATPHIAGYTLEGKVRGTYMLKAALCAWLKQPFTQLLTDYLPEPAIQELVLSERAQIDSVMKAIYDPYADDRRFRASLTQSDQPIAFDKLRKLYPERREFYSLTYSGSVTVELKKQLASLGFSH